MIPYGHDLVFRKDNNHKLAVADKKYGCSHTSKYLFWLNSAAKSLLQLVLSMQCRTEADTRVLNCHFQASNFLTRMEEAKRILCEQVLSSGDLQLVAQICPFLDLCETIRNSAAASRIASGSAPTRGGRCHSARRAAPARSTAPARRTAAYRCAAVLSHHSAMGM